MMSFERVPNQILPLGVTAQVTVGRQRVGFKEKWNNEESKIVLWKIVESKWNQTPSGAIICTVQMLVAKNVVPGDNQ